MYAGNATASLQHTQELMAAAPWYNASAPHPAIKARPPNGVMYWKTFRPLRTYM